LDFLRVKAAYERDNWRLRPLVIVHEVLCRRGRIVEAADWQNNMVELTSAQADRHLAELTSLEERHGVRLRTVRDRLQERFVAQLAIDRLASRLAPAWRAAEAGEDEHNPAFVALASEVESFAATPTGVGLDVPPWLRRLESDLAQLRREKRRPESPESRLSLQELRDQLLHDWNSPLELE
jgi:hypothetical protein